MKEIITKIGSGPDIDQETLWFFVRNYINRYKDGSKFILELKLKQRKKSDPQRKLYFAHVLPKFMEAVGYDPHEDLEVHRFLKIRFFEPQGYLLEKFNLKPIKQDEHGFHHNVPHLFGDKSVITVDVRTKFIEWVVRIAIEYGAEFE